MRVCMRAFLALLIIVGILFAIPFPEHLPVPRENSTPTGKNRYSGVLRLWICEKNLIGSKNLSSWLIRESTEFEKKNDGVYIQITPVSEASIRLMAVSSAVPPDMIVITPDVFFDENDLIKIEAPPALRRDLHSYSDVLVPLCMGFSAWAVNKNSPGSALSGKTLMIPESEDPVSALFALTKDFNKEAAPPYEFGLDLSLPIPEEENPQTSSVNSTEIIPAAESCVCENAVKAFVRGECDAILLSQNGIKMLSNSENTPEFEIVPAQNAYTSRIALLGITAYDGAKREEKKIACRKFLDHLLSDGAQARLESIDAFRVTEGESLYFSNPRLGAVESMLFSSPVALAYPNREPPYELCRARLSECLKGNGGARAFTELLIKEKRIFRQNA